MTRAPRLAAFAACSLGWSFVFLVIRPLDPLKAQVPFLLLPFLGAIAPLGGMLAALVLRRNLPSDRPTLVGRHALRSGLIAATPVLCLTVIGLENTQINAHAFGALMGVAVVFYALIEEWGWRGYLREDLGLHNPLVNALVVTTFWYTWHWWFLSASAHPLGQGLLFLMLFASSLGIGKIAEMTRSVGACAAFHALANILFMTPVIANQLSVTTKAGVLAFCVVIWVPLVRGSSNES